jgi:hypothetical protein
VRLVGVTLAALVIALGTGLGALPFAFGTFNRRWLGVAKAPAGSFMLSASGLLLIEGAIRGWWQALLGAAVGAVFILVSHRLLEHRDVEFGSLRGRDATKARRERSLRRLVEHLLEPASAAGRRAGIPVRRGVQAVPPGRARLCRRRDDMARVRRAAAGSAAGAERGAACALARRLARGDVPAAARAARPVSGLSRESRWR